MEKKRSADWKEILRSAWKSAFVTAAFYGAAILLLAALVHFGVLPWHFRLGLLYGASGAAAFGAAAISLLFTRHQRMLTAMLSQALFVAALVIVGTFIFNMQADWLRLGWTILVMFSSAAAAIALFGGRKIKKFKKNTPIRLKKR